MTASELGRLVGAALACASAAAACGGSAAPPEPARATFTDGTRLKAVYQRIEGAPPFFLNWYDTALQVDCTFMDVGLPDRLVCFPSDPAGATERNLLVLQAAGLFTDSGCTTPALDATYHACGRFSVSLPTLGDGCDTLVRLFSVGEALPADPAGLYDLDVSGCRPASASDLSGRTALRALGPEIPFDALVSGTYQHDPTSGRIVPLRIVGSDGSIQPETPAYSSVWGAGVAQAWDNERGEIVSPSFRPGSRWFPAVQYQANAFSDPACTVAAAIGPACHVGAKESFVWDVDECGTSSPARFYELGAPLADQTSLYYPDSAGDTCLRDTGGFDSPIANPTMGAFAVGAPVSITAFAAAKEVHTGSGQVQIVQAASATDAPAVSIGFFDAAHGQPCTFQRNLRAADGVVRCLPASAELPSSNQDGFYADADCAMPLYQAQAPTTSSCTPPQPTFVSVTEGISTMSACYMQIYRRHVFPIGDAYTGEVFLGFGPGQCFDVGPAASVGIGPFRTVGPEVAAGEFAALDDVRPN